MTQRILFGDSEITGDRLRENGARVASGLHAMGIGQTSRVAVLMRNEPVYLELLRAAELLGAHCVAINWHFKSDEAAHVLQDSEASALIAHADLLPQIAGAVPAGMVVIVVPTPPAILAAYRIKDVPPTPYAALDYVTWRDAQPLWAGPPKPSLGVMLYTSGTTGRAKGVRRLPGTPAQHDGARRVRMLVSGHRRGMRTAILGPLYHAGPNSGARAAMTEAELIILEPRYDAEHLLRLIETHRLTHLTMVPIMLVRLLKLPRQIREKYDVSSLENATHGGSACPPEVRRAMIDWWGPILTETYGSTEAGLITRASAEDFLRYPGTVGRTLPGMSLRILDEAGRVLPPGEIGEIYVDPGENALPFTYHNAEEERRRIEREGHFTNGDMGYLNPEGYLFLADRKRDMVISGGVNIYPAEIEAVLIQHPAVQDCAVYGLPDAEYGEALVAAIEARPGEAPDPAHLRAFLRDRLAGYKVPRRIDVLPALPRDSMGKIFKRRLKEDAGGPSAGADPAAAREGGQGN